MDQKFGFILEQGTNYTAPLWLGEFGENTQSKWWNATIQYLSETNINWAYWAYTGYKTDPSEDESYGIVDSKFTSVRHEWKLADLQGIIPLNTTLDQIDFM